MVVLDFLDLICMYEQGSRKIGKSADSLEYTGPLVAIRVRKTGDDPKNLIVGVGRHPFFHFLFEKKSEAMLASEVSSSKCTEVWLSGDEYLEIKNAAQSKLYEIFQGAGERDIKSGNTLFDALAVDPDFQEKFGDSQKGILIYIHFINKSLLVDEKNTPKDLIDYAGIRISSTNPILYFFLGCKLIATVRNQENVHYYVEEPDFTVLEQDN